MTPAYLALRVPLTALGGALGICTVLEIQRDAPPGRTFAFQGGYNHRGTPREKESTRRGTP